MATLVLGTAKAKPGEKAWGQLLVREGEKDVRLPVAIVHGHRAGEHVVLLANQHGGEINGIESIRLFVERIDPRRLRGTVFAIPSANPLAAMLAYECWPEDDDPALAAKFRQCAYPGPTGDRNTCKYNMNRKWPGRIGGLLVERVVHEIWTRAVLAPHRKASLVMDFHCHQAPSSIYATLPDDVDVGVVSGVPNVIHTRSWGTHRPYSYVACREAGIRAMTVELGGQNRFDDESIEIGRRAIVNLLKFWGMLGGKLELPARTLIMDPWRNDIEKGRHPSPSHCPCLAPHDGLARFHVFPYTPVRKGTLVCDITDPHSGRIAASCIAPMSGVLYSIRVPQCVCRKGERLFDIASVRSVDPRAYTGLMDVADYRHPALPC